MTREDRFGIERIHLTWSAVHEEKDDVLRLRREVWRLRSQRIRRTTCRRSLRMAREEAVPTQKINQGEHRETSADIPKKMPAASMGKFDSVRIHCHLNPYRRTRSYSGGHDITAPERQNFLPRLQENAS